MPQIVGVMSPVMQSASPNLRDAFKEWMPLIDERLRNENILIPDRPFRAAWLFVKLAVLEIAGDTKEGFLQKPWFATIQREAAAWYKEEYGDLLERPEDFLLGLCFYKGAALELHIPRILKRVEKEGETSWMIFPVDIQEEDEPMTWIVRAPNLGSMQSKQRLQLQTGVVKVGTCLRAIALNLVTAKRPDKITDGFANNIFSHLVTSVRHMLEPSQKTFNLACWEAHQAAEKSLKFLSRQKNGAHTPTHDLTKLYNQIGADDRTRISDRLIAKLPTKRQVIKMRTNEGRPLTLLEAYRIYFATLWFVKQCTAVMLRDYGLANARFLLKKPAFLAGC
jgi:HEPN domain-containing protein